eukprot:Em0001g757a
MGNINARDPDYWNVADPPDRAYSHLNWMQDFPDNTSIAQLSIPGTHDTMAHAGVLWAWTQSLALIVQLSLGIRFLDIRCRHYRDSLPVYHGFVYEGVYFEDVLQTTINFLEANPSEVIIMRIEETYSAAENTRGRTFAQQVRIAIDAFPADRFWTINQIPTLEQCRGKIVVVDGFADGTMGIRWADVHLEDHWKTSATNKWAYVRNHLDTALQSSTSPTALFLTFSSFTSGIQAPRELARSMNPKLHEYVRGKKEGRLGIIATDYPGPELIRDIILTNSNFIRGQATLGR